ncbi:hypothetical protein [Aeromonas dhakensis]|uniref:hypothetical protein n=1 Tax=Aeromonas dhakensis TaxID=196024 RepID=UPI0011190FE7|nr:hypothetical protein [Aeromonas dhakensis]
MEENENKRFSTREWWMFILLIVLIQWLIHFWSTEALSSSAMVNYVSFAGTLASTILAVLAIIYSFVQSASQQTTSETISREVHRLQSIVSNVNESTNKVNESLEKLPLIIEQLESIPSTVSETISQGVSPLTQSHSVITNMLSQLITGSGSLLVGNETKEIDRINTVYKDEKLYVIIPALGLSLAAYIILNDKNLNEIQGDFIASVSSESADIVSDLFYSARGALLCLCLQNVFEMDYVNKLKRHPKCDDELWNGMITSQQIAIASLLQVIKDDGINNAVPRDVQDKLKSIVNI